MGAAIDRLLRLNQCPLSWTSTRSNINGLPVEGIIAVDVAESREGEYVQAQNQGGPPLGITSGTYQVDSFSLEFLSDSAEMITQALAISVDPSAGAALGSFGDARWTYQLTAFEPGIPGASPTISLIIAGIKIEKRSFGTQQGSGKLTTKLEGKAINMRTVGVGGGLSGPFSQLWSLQRSV